MGGKGQVAEKDSLELSFAQYYRLKATYIPDLDKLSN